MVRELSIGWNDIINAIKYHYYSMNDNEIKQRFNSFQHYKEMFKPDSPIMGIVVSLGRYDVVMSQNVCVQFLKYTEMTMAVGSIPPLESLVTPLPYEIIEDYKIENPHTLRNTLEKAKKKNKQQERLREARKEAGLARSLVNSNQYIFYSIDIEAYEKDHSILLEIGWSTYDSKLDQFRDQHYINDNYRHLRNGTFVEDEKENFSFGTSVWCSLKKALGELRKDLDWAVKRDGGFVLVGHGFDTDLKYLQQQKFMWPTSDGGQTLNVTESANITILNTDILYAASINNLHNPPSLGRTLNLFNVDTWHLHNAGNDAHYTMLLLLILVGHEL
ncbi:hypothetical protein BDF20DRAFT_164262 [Mycotypha africana]|uniref:uncharacterized protein n=1 Tax=Mycotypha africana TaxID=64632 RepID=UPI00230093F9|nr:uncharacterized protein BDF20DRAFT_164262 [Mycotypha africana]KAI8968164.1 hypothetical protein BDF20DRAFT_164262 [Mycotypha africana]